jgi:hypothetical protein
VLYSGKCNGTTDKKIIGVLCNVGIVSDVALLFHWDTYTRRLY